MLGMDLHKTRFSLKILVAGERFNATGEYFKRGSTSKKKLVIGHQTLAEEFCIVSGEFSDLQGLMNTLILIYFCRKHRLLQHLRLIVLTKM